MMYPLHNDTAPRPAAATLALALCGVTAVAAADYFSGHEISMSLFYMGPVSYAAWYAGRAAGVACAILSCIAWYGADVASYSQYSHPVIPVWNALIRLGFFLSGAVLLATLRRAMDATQRLAQTDALTGIYNRRAFEERLDHDISMAQRRGSAITIACIDLDAFKAVNDRFGHATGDRVLHTVGATLRAVSRQIDTPARLGGDEFALILPDTDAGGARAAIDRFDRQLRAAFAAEGCDVSCSIGAVTVVDPRSSAADMLACADSLMYAVKSSGKGTISFREFHQSIAAAGT